jgi:shikimate dehydrogenase
LSTGAYAKFVGVMGWPLEHTLSPALHNAAFRAADLDWHYLVWPVRPESLAAAVEGLRALGSMGGNVTMPHKEAIVEHLDGVSGNGRAVGAVNTIERLGDRLIGHNTDVDGFRRWILLDAGVDVSGRRVLLLGSGGAARAVLRALDDLDAAEVLLAARRPERAARLKGVCERVAVIDWDEAPERVADADVVVNATPVGADGASSLPGAAWRAGQAVFDLVYAPPATPLVEAARAGGAEAWGGIGMLIHQAAASFRIWTGLEPSLEAMSITALRASGSHHRPRG